MLTNLEVSGFSSSWALLCLFALALFCGLVPCPQGLLFQFRSLGLSIMLPPGPLRTYCLSLTLFPAAVTLLLGTGRLRWHCLPGFRAHHSFLLTLCVLFHLPALLDLPPCWYLCSCPFHCQPSELWVTPAMWAHSGGGQRGGSKDNTYLFSQRTFRYINKSLLCGVKSAIRSVYKKPREQWQWNDLFWRHSQKEVLFELVLKNG